MKNQSILGISTYKKTGPVGSLHYNQLLKEGQKCFDEVIFINPDNVVYQFERSGMKLLYNDRDLTDINAFIVRGVQYHERAVSLLAHSLSGLGCFLLDPLERFSGARDDKMLPSLERMKEKSGVDSYLMFSKEAAERFLHDFFDHQAQPILAKPVAGRKGKGIALLHNFDDAINYINEYFKGNFDDNPILFQRYIKIREEFRVVVLHGKHLGTAKKQPIAGALTANAAQGATFAADDRPDIVEFVLQHVRSDAFLGVDVVQDDQGDMFIIEANYAPVWQEFERVTGVNVAKEVVKFCAEQVK